MIEDTSCDLFACLEWGNWRLEVAGWSTKWIEKQGKEIRGVRRDASVYRSKQPDSIIVCLPWYEAGLRKPLSDISEALFVNKGAREFKSPRGNL